MRRTTASILALALFLTTSGAFAAQVTGLKARHHKGQTFLTWEEVDSPGASSAKVHPAKMREMQKTAASEKKVLYRIYRSAKAIDSLDGLKPIAQVANLRAFNTDIFGARAKKHFSSRNGDRMSTYVIEDGGKELAPGTGLYVHNPRHAENEDKAAPMKGFYAITLVKSGKEDKTLTDGNTIKGIDETEGPGVPILQRTEKPETFNFEKGATVDYYTRWEYPPNASMEGYPFDYLVAVPKNVKNPAPAGIHLHCWGNNLQGGYGGWLNADKGAILIAPNQIPYDWYTGYPETGKPTWAQSIDNKSMVHPYTQNRIISFLEWACENYKIDKQRVFLSGNSMGGSGALMLAIRKPQYFAFCRGKVGVHIPELSPVFKRSYERVWGNKKFDVKFENGVSVWDYFNDVWYMRKYPDREIPFLILSNGKDDNHIGWPQSVMNLRALQETRRAHIFRWLVEGHSGTHTIMPRTDRKGETDMPIDILVNQSVPAFTSCSLDSDPGTGTELKTPKECKRQSGKLTLDKFDGASSGQINGYMYWETADIVDEADKWEMTVAINGGAPSDDCTVNLTPRRCQQFKPAEGTTFKWTNTSGGKEIQSGEVTADKWGLVTIEKLTVGKTKNRIVITKK
jgi:hypothetical protein